MPGAIDGEPRLQSTVGGDPALRVDVVQSVASGGGADPVGLKNIAAAAINPATEDTLQTLGLEATLQDILTSLLGPIDVSGSSVSISGTVSVETKGSLGRPNLYVDVASVGLYEVPCSVLIDPATGSTAAVTSGALNVVNSQSAANTTFDTKAKIAGTSLTGTYQTLKTVAGTSVRTIFLMNTCNQTILVSMDGGSNDTFELEPFESVTLTPAQGFFNRYYAGTIQVKHGGVAPTAGTIRYAGMNS